MTRAELVDQVSLKTDLSKRQTSEVIELFAQCIIEALQRGDKVELRGFGSFRCRRRGDRRGRNPKTNEAVNVPAKTVPFFKTGKALHARLNPELPQAQPLARV